MPTLLKPSGVKPHAGWARASRQEFRRVARTRTHRAFSLPISLRSNGRSGPKPIAGDSIRPLKTAQLTRRLRAGRPMPAC